MTIMIDDVNLQSEEVFYPFFSKMLGFEYDYIKDENQLYDAVAGISEELEIIVHDIDDISEDCIGFARKIISVFMDVRLSKKNLKLNFVNNEEKEI